jgi:DNA-binding PadR family transcriptional regulator
MANFYLGRVGKHRKAKYYELTKAGRLEVEDEMHRGDRIASAIGRLLQAN